MLLLEICYCFYYFYWFRIQREPSFLEMISLPQFSSWTLNPELGLMTLLLFLTQESASGYTIYFLFMRQAITKLALLETPAAQWTRTFRPSLILSQIHQQLESKQLSIFWSQKSAMSYFMYCMLSNLPSLFSPSKGVSRQLPQVQIALIQYLLIVYKSVAASQLPKYRPSMIISISGYKRTLSSLNFNRRSPSAFKHRVQMLQPGPKGSLKIFQLVQSLLHCIQYLQGTIQFIAGQLDVDLVFIKY